MEQKLKNNREKLKIWGKNQNNREKLNNKCE